MTKAVQKITLSPSRDIPFNKLVLSQSNVRRVKAGVSIEQLAESIAQRTLLQSLNVRAVVDAEGNETGMFEVPAGGRRYRAQGLLVKQKRMAKTQAVPCVVREGGIAEDDSLAENDERIGLHLLDQFRAFQALSGAGMFEEDIAARHFVTPAVVKQRLRLASVSPKLHDVYAEDGMTLEQLMAFSVTADQTRQEQVWENVSRSGYDEPYQIRRMLTENTVRASDRRVQFIGLDAYQQAGGGVLRDLFEHNDGGWLQDVALLDRIVTGILIDNWLKGRRRAVPIRLSEGILFTTYATLRTDERGEKLSCVRQIVEWLGSDFDGVIVFDDSHAMQNAAGAKGERGDQAASQHGRAGLRFQHALPNARVVYVSATGATTVHNLAYAQRLGLWGGADFPFATRAEFVEAIEEGGVAAMEVLARKVLECYPVARIREREAA
ncbi:strawberry notch-like NTP hydrolase domain-containing protein [Bradyrhizobium sp. UFLA05-109]